MNTYNPNKPIDPETWLAIDEAERIEMVEQFHRIEDNGVPEEAITTHSMIQVIVENQLAENVAYVPDTVAKLIRQGLTRHDAVHAIGAIISEDVFNIVNGEDTDLSPKKYRRKYEKITAKRWRKGQY
ncbi:MAG: hypothetical protein ACI8WB_004741 [Phenylobacterium sp.]|jgi:hypothetical protein